MFWFGKMSSESKGALQEVFMAYPQGVNADSKFSLCFPTCTSVDHFQSSEVIMSSSSHSNSPEEVTENNMI